MDSQEQPPLFDLFMAMRSQAGIPLTLDQYHLLLRALKGGFGISSRSELKQVCRMLWVKSHSSPEVERFEQCFDRYFEQLDRRPILEENTDSDHGAIAQSPSPPSSPQPTPPPTAPVTIPHQIPTAVRTPLLTDSPPSTSRFSLTAKDFPVTQRQILQNWRSLRRPIREGPLTEIDLEATVEQISRDGIFLEPILIPSRVNRAELLLLVDDSNSMVPFGPLSEQLINAVSAGGFGKTEVYYFRNCPRDYLYRYRNSPEAIAISQLLPKLHHNRTIVITISDGGAARGGINKERIKLTHRFVETIKLQTRYLAWLNPMPKERWLGTTAEFIQDWVNMFEINSIGLKASIQGIKKG
ncbi:MAG TPA: hypothetical protein DDZ80_10500 [Cyanobacteria bacterium UBA8803]|nr:hypothetical protein [Cyanobacteria bacterium UBA9273]HBL58920.1 hypothetical protein [Cyanobacteria bacterium UBA8803]